ncbi:DoxX family protein [Aquibacillus sp. 3ASR75-11]|uniref:DoxX family protein n=1 Tax=Terrihalobacillus insolitus TaxID=2950438 RepID=A0A9X4AKY9_9BACI|nr:DoxX family protein [Terrihalobacillus insolitus]MDC3412706.1 DoxX family protein [Terrihalobacillus insolitus]MDC3423817.1 DoxX family protein [Terrihalobacillus insolitus]
MRGSYHTLDLIRYAVSYVFITSGLIKLLVGDYIQIFSNLGIPSPETVVLLVGLTEIICGCLILFKRYIKQATIILFIIVIGAFLFAKVPILHQGFLQFAFEARLDIVLLVLLTILWRSHK